MKKNQADNTTYIHKIVPKIKEGFFKRSLAGVKSFIAGLLELIKNSDDWHAYKILISFLASNILVITDDGDGMDDFEPKEKDKVSRLQSWMDLGNSACVANKGQSGSFGSGSKHWLFSHVEEVTVTTCSKEHPQWVWTVTLTPDNYEHNRARGEGFDVERHSKNSDNWPFNHPHGTSLRYKLRDSNRTSIKRGADLAKALSNDLPPEIARKVFVDNKAIPEREILGKPFRYEVQTSTRGEGGRVKYPALTPQVIYFDLYRLAKKSSQDCLSVTSTKTPEVPFKIFLRYLCKEDLDAVPAVFKSDVLCGTIRIPFLAKYISENREMCSSDISDRGAEELSNFIDLLREIAPLVEATLDIEILNRSDASSEESMERIADIYNKHYDPDGKRFKLYLSGGDDDDPPTGSRPKGPEQPFRISTSNEFEVGEEIAIVVKRLPESYSIKDITWITEYSGSSNYLKTETGIRLVAETETISQTFVSAYIEGTAFKDKTSYEIKSKRQFKLSPAQTDMEAGDDPTTITALNVDKLKGKVLWSLEGLGEILPQGNRVKYTPPEKLEARETAYVIALDSGNTDNRQMCTVYVAPKSRTRKLLCIRGDYFAYDETGDFSMVYKEDKKALKPVWFIQSIYKDRPHSIHANFMAPTVIAATERGEKESFMVRAIAMEYTRFCLEYRPEDYEVDDFSEIPGLIDRLTYEAYEVLGELYRKKK